MKRKAVVPKKKTTSKDSKAGNPDLSDLFKALRALLKEFEGPLVPRTDTARAYDLWSEKKIVVNGKPRSEIYFAGLAIQGGYVGFYYMPVYANTGLKEVFAPDMLKRLKGKSCFHIKDSDPATLKEIRSALAIGYKMYQDRGWI